MLRRIPACRFAEPYIHSGSTALVVLVVDAAVHIICALVSFSE